MIGSLCIASVLWAAGLRYRLHRRDLPGSPDLSVFSFMPTGPGTTLQIGQCFSPPGAPSDEARHTYRNGVLTDEDVGLCESVQRGLASRGYTAGRLIYDADGKELSEGAVHQFQLLVARATGLIE